MFNQSNDHYPNSYYAASAKSNIKRAKLTEHIQADVCIIGGGYTGLSSAIHLAEKGFKVVLLEVKRIGFGASGRNGGQIVHSYSRDIDFIKKHFGDNTGDELGSMAFEGGKILRRFVKQYHIDCDLKSGGVFAACNEKQLTALAKKKELWQHYGHQELELLDFNSIKHHANSDRFIGGLLDKSSGHFHPLNLALGEAAAIEKLGGLIFENSKVEKIVEGNTPKIVTRNGSVSCNFTIVAGNAYLDGLLPELERKAIPCGTQIITTERLTAQQQQEILPSDHCVEDCNYLLDYFRLSGDGRLIYGGGVTYGAREPKKITSMVQPNMLKTFPQLADCNIDYAWTGNFCLTLMRLPQFGRVNNNIYYAQGYSGHGVTSSHLAGKLIAESIIGQAQRFDVFASLPQYAFPGGKYLRVPYTAMGAWLYHLKDKLGI